MDLHELRAEIHRIYEEMPTEQPDIPQHLIDEQIEKHGNGTFLKPSQENWENCHARWMLQLEQAKYWIDVVYRNYAAHKPETADDRLVISNCKHLIEDFERAKYNGFMELGWIENVDELN